MGGVVGLDTFSTSHGSELIARLTSQGEMFMASSDQSALAARAREITDRELAIYSDRTVGSQRATDRTRKVMPAGVPSSFQAYDPHPIVVSHAAGSRMIDVDDNEYIDYDMGFGALFAGHMNPHVRRAVEDQLDSGTLYVTPCELNGEVGELLAERYGFPCGVQRIQELKPRWMQFDLLVVLQVETKSSRSKAGITATTTK